MRVLPACLALFLDVALAGGIAVVFGFRAVADDKYLHIFKQGISCPKRLPPVAVYLVESLFEQYAPAFQFDVYQWQAVYEDGHVIPVGVGAVVRLILVDDLCGIGVDVLWVDELDVAVCAIVQPQCLHRVLLYGTRLVLDTFALTGYFGLEEALPFPFGEWVTVQSLDLPAQVGYQFRFLAGWGKYS